MSGEDVNLSENTELPVDHNGVVIVTLDQDNAIEIIERLRETHVSARGRAFLLSSTPLVERLGVRWDVKKAAVWEHVRASFTRRFQEPDWCVPIGEIGWLLLLPTLGPRMGAMRCAEVWAETAAFFVGEGVRIGLPLFEVNPVDTDRISLRPIDIDKYFDRDEHFSSGTSSPIRHVSGPDAGRSKAAAIGDMRPMNRSAAQASAYMRNETDLRVACAIEPVFEMKQLIIIGHRFEVQAFDPLGQVPLDARGLRALDWGKREAVDIANIEQGLELMQQRPPEKRKVLMVVPVAFSTLASARARNRITADVSKAATGMRMKVLYEIRELGGVPPHRILEIVSLLRPFCMTVVGHVQPEMKAIRNMKECGLSGVCIDYDGAERDEMALRDYLQSLTQAARASSGACMVQGLNNFRQMAVARLAGVTHASVRGAALTTTGARA